MSRVSVTEAASRLGVNVQRVHQRIADGSLAAERVGHQWTIDEADVARLDQRPAGRPLSARSAWAMVLLTADPPDAALAAPERSRARTRLRELHADAAGLDERHDEATTAVLSTRLRSLLRGRAERRLFRAAPRDLPDLRSDDRVALSGTSLPAAGIASGDLVEGYVFGDQLSSVVDDFLLGGASHREANVVLHVVDPEALRHRSVPTDSWLLLAADLAEHHRPRETARAVQLLREAAVPGADAGV